MNKKVTAALIACAVAILVVVFICIFISNDNKEPNENENKDVLTEETGIEKLVKNIDEYAKTIDDERAANINMTSGEESITDAEYGEVATDFLKNFDVEFVASTVYVHSGDMVMISPYSDFLDIESFYFQKEKLVLYRRDFIGIGGNAKYYFEDDKLVHIAGEIDEDMFFTEEEEADILQRAQNVYSRFINTK